MLKPIKTRYYKGKKCIFAKLKDDFCQNARRVTMDHDCVCLNIEKGENYGYQEIVLGNACNGT